MTEWPEARQIAANYQSPGTTGIGFAQFASTGAITPELWDNIRSCEAMAGELHTEGWRDDMIKLRHLLQTEYGVTEPDEEDEDVVWFPARELVDAMKAEGFELNVTQTGGGTATFELRSEGHRTFLIGPGAFDWGNALESQFTTSELYYGPDQYDDEGEPLEIPEDEEKTVKPGTPMAEIAKEIAANYRRYCGIEAKES